MPARCRQPDRCRLSSACCKATRVTLSTALHMPSTSKVLHAPFRGVNVHAQIRQHVQLFSTPPAMIMPAGWASGGGPSLKQVMHMSAHLVKEEAQHALSIPSPLAQAVCPAAREEGHRPWGSCRAGARSCPGSQRLACARRPTQQHTPAWHSAVSAACSTWLKLPRLPAQ